MLFILLNIQRKKQTIYILKREPLFRKITISMKFARVICTGEKI